MTEKYDLEDLNRDWLNHFAGEWAESLGNIEKIDLHTSTKKHSYLLVFWLKEIAPTTPNVPKDNTCNFKDCKLPSCRYLHSQPTTEDEEVSGNHSETMRDVIFKTFINNDSFRRVYKGNVPVDFMDQWETYPAYNGETIPKHIGIGPHSWQLYPGLDEQENVNLTEQIDKQQNAFIRQGKTWKIFFHGKELNPIPHVDGLSYIAELLRTPSRRIHVTNLCDAVTPQKKDNAMMGDDDLTDALNTESMFVSGMQDEGIDECGKKAIGRRLDELKGIINDDDSLISEKEAAQKEYDGILKTLNSQYGKNPLRNKTPKKVNESVKKEMDKVTKAINRAITQIKEQSPELATYLKKNLQTGAEYYFTDVDTLWDVTS